MPACRKAPRLRGFGKHHLSRRSGNLRRSQDSNSNPIFLPDPCRSNPELETPPSAPWPMPPDHSHPDALSLATASEPQRHKSGTKAKRERRLLRKMQRHQGLISKSKNFVQNFIAGWQSEKTPVPKKTVLPPDPLETRNPALETPLLEPETPLLTTPKQGPEFEPEICLLETPNQKLKTKNRLPETANQKPKTENWLLKTANRLLSKPKPPPPYDETSRRADELFEISHGYKRHNPPKHIPDRRRDEDFRSHTIFGDVNNTLKHMLG